MRESIEGCACAAGGRKHAPRRASPIVVVATSGSVYWSCQTCILGDTDWQNNGSDPWFYSISVRYSSIAHRSILKSFGLNPTRHGALAQLTAEGRDLVAEETPSAGGPEPVEIDLGKGLLVLVSSLPLALSPLGLFLFIYRFHC
jgi:hypothetical protein